MTLNKTKLPETGRPFDEVLDEMRTYGAGDPDYKQGRTWSLVYYLGEDYTRFLEQAHRLYFSANGLNPMVFKSLKRFETEVVRMTADLLNGDADTAGTMTSGGTESCLLAVKTYRDLARRRKPGIRRPEMILPVSAHVAWEKGAEYFGLRIVRAPLGADFRVDVAAVRRMVGKNTALIVASAPQYPHGVVDPIAELGNIAQSRKVPLHVDACVGGYLLPFVEKLGYPVPAFDFRVPGVSSISADTHKYGFAAKGASTIIYRNSDLLQHQIFVSENWPGGVFASPALLGTRPGGSIAAAWAAMQAMGADGYMRNARAIMETRDRLIDGVGAIDALQVLGAPHMSLFAYGSRSPQVNIFAVGDAMEERGWHIDRQQRPDCLHAMVTPLHADVIAAFLSDLRASAAHVKAHPELAARGSAAMYGMISKVPFRGLIRQEVTKMMMEMYGPAGKVPDLAAAAEGSGGKGGRPDLATRLGMGFLKLTERLRRRR